MSETYNNALSVRDPWARAILYLGKDVENRSWAAPAYLYGTDLLIHVSLRVEKQEPLERRLAEYPQHLGAIIGVVRLVTCTENYKSRWANPDSIHWVLTNPRPFTRPVPWTGRLGIFKVPESAIKRAR